MCTLTCIAISLIIAATIYYLRFVRTKPKLDIPSRDRVVVVSGAAGGFGTAICRDLLSRFNARVIGLDISKEVMEKVYSEELKQYGSERLSFIECNICKLEECEKASERIAQILKEWKTDRVFALVNNAGVSNSPKCTERMGIVEYPEDELLDVFGSNLFGHVRMTRLLYPLMKDGQDGHNGAIINVASVAGLLALGFFGFYTSSKFAMVGFTDSLRREMKSLGKKGLRVTCIEPGFAKTQILNMKPFSESSQFYKPYMELYQVAKKMMDNAQSPQKVSSVICEQLFSSNNEKHILIDHWYMRLLNKFLFYSGVDL